MPLSVNKPQILRAWIKCVSKDDIGVLPVEAPLLVAVPSEGYQPALEGERGKPALFITCFFGLSSGQWFWFCFASSN